MSSVAKPWLNSWPLHSMGNTGPILSGQNMTLWFSMCSISTNILTVLANFLGIQNSIFSKNIGRNCGNTTGRWQQQSALELDSALEGKLYLLLSWKRYIRRSMAISQYFVAPARFLWPGRAKNEWLCTVTRLDQSHAFNLSHNIFCLRVH